MSTASIDLRGGDRGGRIRGGLFHGLLLVSVTVGFVLLATLLIDVFRKGLPYLDADPALRRALVLPQTGRERARRSSGRST